MEYNGARGAGSALADFLRAFWPWGHDVKADLKGRGALSDHEERMKRIYGEETICYAKAAEGD